jgi:hypothetical protein
MAFTEPGFESNKPRPRLMPRVIFLIAMVALLVVGIPAIYTPWGFFMGGGFRLLPIWKGYGKMHSNTAGGDYVFQLYFYPQSGRWIDNGQVTGSAVMCTPRGERFFFKLGGNFQKDIKLDTNGKTARFYMKNHGIKSLNTGDDHPHLILQGHWNNPDLVLDDEGSLARNFQRDGTLSANPAKASAPATEVVPVTIHEASTTEFNATCAAVKASRP